MQGCCTIPIGTDWSEWSGCSASCGGIRFRSKAAIVGGGSSCFVKDDTEEEICNMEACSPTVSLLRSMERQPCELTDWSDWSACTVTCGQGTVHRLRNLVSSGNDNCVEKTVDAAVCGAEPCFDPTGQMITILRWVGYITIWVLIFSVTY